MNCCNNDFFFLNGFYCDEDDEFCLGLMKMTNYVSICIF